MCSCIHQSYFDGCTFLLLFPTSFIIASIHLENPILKYNISTPPSVGSMNLETSYPTFTLYPPKDQSPKRYKRQITPVEIGPMQRVNCSHQDKILLSNTSCNNERFDVTSDDFLQKFVATGLNKKGNFHRLRRLEHSTAIPATQDNGNNKRFFSYNVKTGGWNKTS